MFGLDFTQLGIIGAILVALGGMIWKLLASAKGAGITQERARQADAWNQTQTRVEQAVAQADSRSTDAMRQRLRERAIDAPSSGDPVQRR